MSFSEKDEPREKESMYLGFDKDYDKIGPFPRIFSLSRIDILKSPLDQEAECYCT
jgi:hypothetical protein